MKKLLAMALAGTMAMSMVACGAVEEAASEAESIIGEEVEQAAETAASEVAEESGETATEVIEEATAALDLQSEAAQSPALADGVLTVGLNATFPPFEYIDTNGNPTGFDVAMMNEIGSRLGVTVEIDDMDFDGIVAAIGNKIDVGATGMTITEERLEAVNFSDSYYDATQAVLLPADSTIATAEDLAAATIECQSGTTGESVARGINDAGTTSVKSFNQAVTDLVNGKCDAVVIDAVPASAFQSQYSDQLKVVDGATFDFDVEQYGIAMPKDDDHLKAAIDAALSEMRADGTYDALVEEWINNYEAE